MTGRYEIRDRAHPEWRGQRFASLDRAKREMRWVTPTDRFVLIDRETGDEVDR